MNTPANPATLPEPTDRAIAQAFREYEMTPEYFRWSTAKEAVKQRAAEIDRAEGIAASRSGAGDALRELAAQWRDGHCGGSGYTGSAANGLLNDCADELEAALAAANLAGGDGEDAARYRWLRDEAWKHEWEVFIPTDKNASGFGAWYGHDDRDAAIDAARKADAGRREDDDAR